MWKVFIFPNNLDLNRFESLLLFVSVCDISTVSLAVCDVVLPVDAVVLTVGPNPIATG